MNKRAGSSAAIGSQKRTDSGPFRVSWSHPLTTLLPSTAIGFLGWAGHALWLDRGGITARTDDARSPATIPLSPVNNASAGVSGADGIKQGPAASTPTQSPTSGLSTASPQPARSSPETGGSLPQGDDSSSGPATPQLASTRDSRQDIALITPTVPHIGSARLFCDTLQTTLVINYAFFGSHPVAVTRIAFHADPIDSAQPNACQVDPLSSQPKGIVLRDSYVFTIRNSSLTGKYIVSGKVGDASDISVDNILETHNGTQTITMQPTEEPIVRDVYVNSIASLPRKIWFTVYYDAQGERSVDTEPLYIARSQ